MGDATHGFAMLKQSLEGEIKGIKGMKEELGESPQFEASSAEARTRPGGPGGHDEGLRGGHRVITSRTGAAREA